MRLFLLLFTLTCSLFAESRTEQGEIYGAKYYIEIPENWKGGLVMFCHGYDAKPSLVGHSKQIEPFLEQGYAVAQSGYSRGGWAVEEAISDTENLRAYFVKKHGEPKETYVSGASMGGHISLTLIEQLPDVYDGALPLCGEVAPAYTFMKQHVFDLVIQFNHYFPGVLPALSKLPKDYQRSKGKTEEIEKALGQNPIAAQLLRQHAAVPTNAALAPVVDFFTEILAELKGRTGGNSFDNRNTVYGNGDPKLNAGVERLEAELQAAGYVRLYSNLSGKLAKPVVAIQTTFDPLIPPWVTNYYANLVEQNGRIHLFVQKLVDHNGHCNISPAEIGQGFRELREWKGGGPRPAAGLPQH